MDMPNRTFADRFQQYFGREVAQAAARPLADGARIGFAIAGSDGEVTERFLFRREKGQTRIESVGTDAAPEGEVSFMLTPLAAETILEDPAEDIGTIGVNILKLVVSPDANRRVTVRVHAGFFTLFTQGYFGVLKNGGAALASFLASRGMGGMDAIKSALKNFRSNSP